MTRRSFIQTGLTVAGMAAFPPLARAKKSASLGHVVIVGAGYGGATAAKYLRIWSGGQVAVTLIEPRPRFISCPVSNRVFSGSVSMAHITHPYQHLQSAYGIRMINAFAHRIDPERKMVMAGDQNIKYDRLIVCTGIDFDYSALPMVNAQIQDTLMPHAWKAGAQTAFLKKQIEALPDGGVVVMTIPPVPYRCPPGPYERACQIAYYLKTHKPRSKIIILDANPAITSKRALFERAWIDLYPGIIEYQSSQAIESIDVDKLMVNATFGRYKADVLNFIPPQTAGRLALDAGLSNQGKRWCDVNYLNYESSKISDIHILGDSVDSALPKSAHIANAEAKVCANAIIAELSGNEVVAEPAFANLCYSYVDDRQAMHIAGAYRYSAEGKVMQAAPGGGMSDAPSVAEGTQADAWAANIWADTLK